MMTKRTRRAMLIKGMMAMRMAFMTIWRLGTPEISLKGLKTLKALRALTSKPSICRIASTSLIILK